MRDFLDKVKEIFDREWSGEEKVLIMLCCVLLGVIYGFLISPIKKGISVGNNNGNNYNGAYIYLNNDITLNIDERWTPVGVYITIDSEQNNPFMGIFDGKNHKINGININTTDKCQGLFGLVEKGTVKNVILGTENNISGGLVTAGIVAYAYDETQIINCNNMAKIESSGKTVGGIVGVANKNVKIQKNFNSGEILRKR